jgi:hypothetical protein
MLYAAPCFAFVSVYLLFDTSAGQCVLRRL